MATLENPDVTATFEATRAEAFDLTSESVDIGRFARVVYLEGGSSSTSTISNPATTYSTSEVSQSAADD